MAIIPRWRSYKETFYRESSRECLNWRSYEGGALIKVADSVIFTVYLLSSINMIKGHVSQPPTRPSSSCIIIKLHNHH